MQTIAFLRLTAIELDNIARRLSTTEAAAYQSLRVIAQKCRDEANEVEARLNGATE